MASKVKQLIDKGFITSYPPFVKETHYETIMGSVAYGVSNDMSDVDIYGFTIPPKNIIFPHLDGFILGFGRHPELFEQFIKHHIVVEEKGEKRSYDIQIFNIVKYFDMAMKANPNIWTSLNTPINVVLHRTPIGDKVRSNRHLFFSKKGYSSYKEYAYSQLHKCKNKNPKGLKELEEFEKKYSIDSFSEEDLLEEFEVRQTLDEFKNLSLSHLDYEALEEYLKLLRSLGNRAKGVREKGTDTKFLYHTVRLIDEIEQILMYGEVDLQRSKEQLKAIRRGDLSFEEVEKWFISKENELNKLAINSTAIPDAPDENAIKRLLLDCLEEYYGSLEGSIVRVDEADQLLRINENAIHRNKNRER